LEDGSYLWVHKCQTSASLKRASHCVTFTTSDFRPRAQPGLDWRQAARPRCLLVPLRLSRSLLYKAYRPGLYDKPPLRRHLNPRSWPQRYTFRGTPKSSMGRVKRNRRRRRSGRKRRSNHKEKEEQQEARYNDMHRLSRQPRHFFRCAIGFRSSWKGLREQIL
jgi:hypothetical protein